MHKPNKHVTGSYFFLIKLLVPSIGSTNIVISELVISIDLLNSSGILKSPFKVILSIEDNNDDLSLLFISIIFLSLSLFKDSSPIIIMFLYG